MPEKRQVAEEKFRQIHFLHRRIMEKNLECTGVYHSQHRVLMYLAMHEGCSQTEMAQAHGISPAAIAVHLKKLEKMGLIERVVDAADNRCNLISITKKGREIVEKSHRIFAAVDGWMFYNMSDGELDTFIRCMGKVQENLEAAESCSDLVGRYEQLSGGKDESD